MKKILAATLAMALLFLCGCSAKSAAPEDSKAFVKINNVTVSDGKAQLLKFEGTKKVNRIVLEGHKLGELTIEIHDEWNNLIYMQRSDSDTRFCAFDTVDASKLSIIVKGGNAKFKSISAYYDTYDTEAFRVVSYVVADRILDKANLNSESFDIITDVILFSCASFDENGELSLNGFEEMDGETYLSTALNNLREVIGKRNVRIHLNILGPNADEGIDDWNKQMENKAAKHSKAFENAALIDQIKALAEKSGVDGIFFDYEFTMKKNYWNDFNNFLVKLKDAIPEKTLGLALADWDVNLDEKALKAVDMVEMMEYDLFDKNGDHASFETAENGINTFLKKGVDKSKLDLGIPFYGRPVDKGGFWYEYKAYADELGLYENKGFSKEQNIDAYFDSYQRVYDKTALALERGIGGMMVWHYTCDDFENPQRSLFNAMKNCIENRTK